LQTVDVTSSLQYQKIQRCSETWKQTLRYHEPNLDYVPGLRRITLNHNTEIRDEGAVYLMNTARDDLFLKGERLNWNVRFHGSWTTWITCTL
jgi:centrosomal protein CEP78